jgi:hypothetical protein
LRFPARPGRLKARLKALGLAGPVSNTVRRCVSATVSTVLYIHYCICCCSSTSVYLLLCICRSVSAAVYIVLCILNYFCISAVVNMYPDLVLYIWLYICHYIYLPWRICHCVCCVVYPLLYLPLYIHRCIFTSVFAGLYICYCFCHCISTAVVKRCS